MAIASTGSFTATDLQSELGKTGPFNASDLRELNGIGSTGPFTSTDLYGKSIIAVSVPSSEHVLTQSKNSRGQFKIKATVIGGASPYSYVWRKVSGSSKLDIDAGINSAEVTIGCDVGDADANHSAVFECTVNGEVKDSGTQAVQVYVVDLGGGPTL